MAHQVGDRDIRLSGRGELRPVASHRRGEVELAQIGPGLEVGAKHGLRRLEAITGESTHGRVAHRLTPALGLI
jgi:hypothetical protein